MSIKMLMMEEQFDSLMDTAGVTHAHARALWRILLDAIAKSTPDAVTSAPAARASNRSQPAGYEKRAKRPCPACGRELGRTAFRIGETVCRLCARAQPSQKPERGTHGSPAKAAQRIKVRCIVCDGFKPKSKFDKGQICRDCDGKKDGAE